MQNSNSRPQTVLGNDWTDFALTGGASIVLFAIVMVTLNRTSPDSGTTWFIYYLSFAVNFPHFLASYQILYYDFRKKLFKEPRMIWAGLVVPALLIGGLAYGMIAADRTALGYFVQLMYFTVGWHYVKQILGVMIVTNARKNIFFNKTERLWLKTHLFSIWAWSFVNSNIGQQSYALEGISYPSLNLPPMSWSFAAALVTVTGAMTAYQFLQKYIREGTLPTIPALGALFALYCWYLPTLYHPVFWLMVPFFHSLQYLLFVFAYKRNEVTIKAGWPDTPEARGQWVRSFGGYAVCFFVTGAFFMHILPHWLDRQSFSALAVGPSAWAFAFTVFINVHHYFIDNVLWRAHNPEMQAYLFRPELPPRSADSPAKSSRRSA